MRKKTRSKGVFIWRRASPLGRASPIVRGLDFTGSQYRYKKKKVAKNATLKPQSHSAHDNDTGLQIFGFRERKLFLISKIIK